MGDASQIGPELAFFEAFARQRGAIQRGNQVDLDHACRLFLNELRQGTLGPVTLEVPADEARERMQLEELAENKKTDKQARKKKRK